MDKIRKSPVSYSEAIKLYCEAPSLHVHWYQDNLRYHEEPDFDVEFLNFKKEQFNKNIDEERMNMRKITFEIKKSKSKTQPYFWDLVASNGQLYAHSETFTQKASARQSIKNIIKAIAMSAVTIEDKTKG